MNSAGYDDKEVIDVIYIMGSGRSGSTLLSSILGTQEDILSAGEIYNYMNFFDSAQDMSRKCSCGAGLLNCEFWGAVRKHVEQHHGAGLLDLKNVDEHKFSKNNHAVFSALKEVSGKRVIVDSSKRHYRLRLLIKSKLFRITIVHLIRDVRAYAYSSLVTARKKGMGDIAYYKKTWEWQKKNVAIKAIYGARSNYVQIRYEDLVLNYESEIKRLLDICNIDFDSSRLFNPAAHTSHEFSGNSGFMASGLKSITLDKRYLNKLTARQWSAATILALPALKLFGYSLFKRGAED